ncbi:MAG: ABC transporter ATP-binding protein [Desulfurococcaceae archaeon]
MSGGRLLRVSDLTVHYYTAEGVVKALRNVSLEVDSGDSLCVIGESGTGKSTLGLAIALSLPKNAVVVSGSILYKGVDLLKLPPSEAEKYKGREISMIFQDPATTFNPLFTIGEHLTDVLRYHFGLSRQEALGKAAELLKMVRLPDPSRILNAYPHELSGGMLQRAAIAAALAPRPKVLIADEPTTMLDVVTQAQILDLLDSLRRDLDLTLILITHNLGIASEVCNKTVVMYAGVVVEEGPTEDVILNPLHPYTAKLVKAVPVASKTRGKLSYIPGALPDLRNPPMGCPFADRCEHASSKCRTAPLKYAHIGHTRRVACVLYGE